ncbi:MAG TPA: prevent-host-death protein [Synechococcales bacterium UBA10510]|nr:prevent-host-death protein [Synechococcales bacterium UBA10510]
MQAISANDLKTGGIGAISRALEHEREVGLSVRGELRFVVMEADAYQRLRECELEIALQEARADLAAGRVVYESVDDHLKRLDAMAIGPDDEVKTSHSQP